MDLIVRCKVCNKELTSSTKIQVCGCPNRMEVCNNKISAIDLKKVVVVEYEGSKQRSLFSKEDLEYQESRRQRKVRKLDFEIR